MYLPRSKTKSRAAMSPHTCVRTRTKLAPSLSVHPRPRAQARSWERSAPAPQPRVAWRCVGRRCRCRELQICTLASDIRAPRCIRRGFCAARGCGARGQHLPSATLHAQDDARVGMRRAQPAARTRASVLRVCYRDSHGVAIHRYRAAAPHAGRGQIPHPRSRCRRDWANLILCGWGVEETADEGLARCADCLALPPRALITVARRGGSTQLSRQARRRAWAVLAR